VWVTPSPPVTGPLLEEYKHHASVRNLVVEGYQLLSF